MRIHIVQKGDTLWNIAKKYGVDFEQLKHMNTHLSNPDMIMPGMKIKIPAKGVPVKTETNKAVHPYIDKSVKAVPVMEKKQMVKEIPKQPEMPKMSVSMPKVEIKPEINNYNIDFEFESFPNMQPVPGKVPGKIPNLKEEIEKESKWEAPKIEQPELGGMPMYPHMSNMPMANAPMANMPLANAPMMNAPLANMPMANAPMANMPHANAPLPNAPMANAPMMNAPAPQISPAQMAPQVMAPQMHEEPMHCYPQMQMPLVQEQMCSPMPMMPTHCGCDPMSMMPAYADMYQPMSMMPQMSQPQMLAPAHTGEVSPIAGNLGPVPNMPAPNFPGEQISPVAGMSPNLAPQATMNPYANPYNNPYANPYANPMMMPQAISPMATQPMYDPSFGNCVPITGMMPGAGFNPWMRSSVQDFDYNQQALFSNGEVNLDEDID